MTVRALGIDVGARTGFGLIAPDEVRSGSFEFITDWHPFGKKAKIWDARLREHVADYSPTHIGIATQYVRRGDTPRNLIPMYWAFGTVLKLAADLGIPALWINEHDARLDMLGAGNMPAQSEPLKRAIHQACRDRGWFCCDWNASDALCIAAKTVAKVTGNGHATMPLFIAGEAAQPKKPKRKRKAA